MTVKATIRTVFSWSCPICKTASAESDLAATRLCKCRGCGRQFEVEPPFDTVVSPEVIVLPDTPEMLALIRKLPELADRITHVEIKENPAPPKKTAR